MLRRTSKVLAGGAAVAAAGYAALAAQAWWSFGTKRTDVGGGQDDRLLETFMPIYDVVERHQIGVEAPAEVTLAAAREQDLQGTPVIRAIFKTRELVMGAVAGRRGFRELIPELLSLGWGVLAEEPGRQIVLGTVTKPWEANVAFHAVPPEHFAAFSDPGMVKIVLSLRADAVSPGESVFRTETRAVATDERARVLFRRYWSLVAPGVRMIRRATLRPLKAEAERRADRL